MKTPNFFKKNKSLKIMILVGLLVVVLGVGAYLMLANNDSSDIATTPSNNGSKNGSSSKESSNSQNSSPNTDQSNNPEGNATPASGSFKITKVYFASAPQVPSGAGFGQCSLGQVITYEAIAQVTASNKGTMQYNWQVADHLGGTVDKQSTQSYTFDSPGTKSISSKFNYTVRDTGNGSNLYNRQYINLFTTLPNATYANIDNPVYAYKNGSDPFFIWGTYIDIC